MATAQNDFGVPNSQGWLNVADGIFHNARRRPNHLAIIDGARSVSYAELALLVSKSSGYLRKVGVKPKDIIGVALGDNMDHLVALLAIARYGAIILPMDVRWTTEEKRRIAAHFGAAFVFVGAGSEPIPGITTVAFDQEWRRGVEADDGEGPFIRKRDHPLVLSLSSGTTGMPKGPLVTHGHTLSRLYIYAISLTFNENDRFMAATPLYFGGGRYMSMFYLFIGGTVILYPPPYKPQELARAINEMAVTSLFLVPTQFRGLIDLPKTSKPLFPKVRVLISSGSSLYPEERRKISQELSPHFYNFYSSTEGGGISVLRPQDPDAFSMSVGQPVFAAEVQVVDDHDQPVPAGLSGRVRYRGGSVADSFYRDPEASAVSFRDGWYYPGDLGRLDEQGYLYLTGRSKDMIIRSGVNIYPVEIEQTLIAHPAVADAAVVGWPSRQRGEEVAAFVVRHNDVTDHELIEHCRRSLAPYKLPKAIFFVDDLPKSGMGKILKAKLVQQLPLQDSPRS